PEVFFVKSSSQDQLAFYGRTDRRPAWLEEDRISEQTFPVTIGHSSTVARQILDRVKEDAEAGQEFSVFDLTLPPAPRDRRSYQVIASMTYEDLFRERPRTIVGFMVDLDWIRTHYVPNIVIEVSRTPNVRRDVTYTILDEGNERVAGTQLDDRSPMS